MIAFSDISTSNSTMLYRGLAHGNHYACLAQTRCRICSPSSPDGVIYVMKKETYTSRPYAQAMEAFIADSFPGIPQTSAMLIGVHGETLRDSNRSSYNFTNASMP